MDGLTILFAFLLSAVLTWYLCHPAAKLRILDAPNERSLHEIPVPRTGGLAIIAASLTSASPLVVRSLSDPAFARVSAAAALLAVVSFVDDRSGLTPGFRLLIHLAAAVLVLSGGLAADKMQLPGWQWAWPSLVSLVVSALFLVWMTNLYNFMDGMDGFAGGMTVVGFSTYALLGWQANEALFTLASLTVAASAAGFLLFNFPPAKIFMGDTGASVLGFLSACFSLWASSENIFPIWLGVLVFSPFVVDATVTLVRRLLAGQRVWVAHRSHYYQRLVRAGWGHRKTVIVEYGLMVAAGLSAAVAVGLSAQWQWILIIFWCFIYLGLGLLVRRVEYEALRGG